MFDTNSDKFAGALLFFAAAFWGLYWLPLRSLEQAGLSSAWSVAFFNICPLIILVPYILIRRASHTHNLRAVVFIGLMTGIGLSCYATGLVVSSVIRATLLFYLTPVWSTIIGVIWLRERLSLGRLVAIGLGFAGLYFLLSGGDGTSAPLNFGDFLAVLSGIFWGFGAAAIKKWPDTSTMSNAAMQLFVAAVTGMLFALFIFGEQIPDAATLATSFPIAFVASTFVILPSLYAIFWASKRLFPGRVGLLMMSEVLVAILSASLLLPDETLSPWQWIGGGIVLVACVVEILTKDEKTKLPVAPNTRAS